MAGEGTQSPVRTAALLSGRRALVTGASAGLGRAIVECFAAAGARGIAFDLDAPAGLPEGWSFNAGDAAEESDIARACARAGESLGGLDILVANAGITAPWRESETVELGEWDRLFAVNVRGVMAAIKHAVPLMKGAGGAIVAMASINALQGHARQAAYTASKHAVLGIVRAAARDLGRHAIRVNALAPGPIATEALIRRIGEREAAGGPAAKETLARYADTPLGRMASEADVAQAALFLASDLASGVTGQMLSVDAGATA